nr:GGDEF domain-containing protein [uncultured Desulfuromonas sp.]
MNKKINYCDLRIYAECVRVIYQNRIPSLVSVLIASFIPLVVGLGVETRTVTLISVSILWFFVVANFMLCHWFNKTALSDEATVKWGTFFYVEHFFLAILLDVIFFYYVFQDIDGSLFYLVLVSLGFSAGSVSAFHQLKWAPAVFIATTISPQIIFYLLQPSRSSHVVAVMLLIILVFMSIISLEQHKNWIKTLALSFELDAAKREAERIARIDLLTGLYNRRAFYEIAPKFIENARRYSRSVSLVMLDIDYFKNINDTFGHSVGDRVLVKVAELLSSQVRGADSVGRLGGEEFVILLPETDEEGAYALVEKIRNQVRCIHCDEVDGVLEVTASFGVVTCRNNDESLDSLLKKADEALYLAKDQGRNKTVIYQP